VGTGRNIKTVLSTYRIHAFLGWLPMLCTTAKPWMSDPSHGPNQLVLNKKPACHCVCFALSAHIHASRDPNNFTGQLRLFCVSHGGTQARKLRNVITPKTVRLKVQRSTALAPYLSCRACESSRRRTWAWSSECTRYMGIAKTLASRRRLRNLQLEARKKSRFLMYCR